MDKYKIRIEAVFDIVAEGDTRQEAETKAALKIGENLTKGILAGVRWIKAKDDESCRRPISDGLV